MTHDLLIYLAAFIGPFVQEDAAILGAVTAFLHPDVSNLVSAPLILVAMFVGLTVSDLWKYWIGYAGRSQAWAQKLANKPTVTAIASKIISHPGKTLMLARFIPGTRIPAYIAAGFFGVQFARFTVWIVVSAGAYVAVAWLILSTIGEVAGKLGQYYVAAALIILLLGYTCISTLRSRRA
jgi:membrane protein DedA with SNARE-associated domain